MVESKKVNTLLTPDAGFKIFVGKILGPGAVLITFGEAIKNEGNINDGIVLLALAGLFLSRTSWIRFRNENKKYLSG